MATPNVRAGSAVGGLIPTAALTATLDKPIGTVAGDLIVYLLAFSNNSNGTHTPPAGFVTPTGLTAQLASGGNSATLLVKVAGASEPATYTHSWTSGTSGAWVGLAVSNIATTWQDVVAELVGSTADTNHVMPSVDPAKTEGLLLTAAAADNPGVGLVLTYNGTPAGMTKQVERSTGNTAAAALFTQALANADPTGAKTAVASTATRYAGFSVVISSPTSVAGGTAPVAKPQPWRLFNGTTELRGLLTI